MELQGLRSQDKPFVGSSHRVSILALLFFLAVCRAAGSSKEGTWMGAVTATRCGTRDHAGDPAECVKRCVSMGARYALLTDGQVYVLNPQDKAVEYAGHEVKVTGVLKGSTIRITSIEGAEEKVSSGKSKVCGKPHREGHAPNQPRSGGRQSPTF